MLTIGITCFREGRLLEECWDSVLAQTTSSWEAVLIMDGGSDKATGAVFGRIDHPRLRKFAQADNMGPYATRNRAMLETRTPWHYYLDGDDLLAPTAIEELLEAIHVRPEADVIYTDVSSWWPGKRRAHMASAADIDADTLTGGHALFGANAIRRALWERLGGFAMELAWTLADLDFYMSAFERGAVFHHLARPLYLYRRRPGSVSESYLDRYHEIYALLVARHPGLFADRRRRDRFLALGHLMTARFHHVGIRMDDAERHAREAYDLCGLDEAELLLRKIQRDRSWPAPLLRLRRKMTRLASAMAKR